MKIIFEPRYVVLKAGYIFLAVTFIPMAMLLFAFPFNSSFFLQLLALLACLILILNGYASRKYIFDTEKQILFSTSIFGTKEICVFPDIEEIEKMVSSSGRRLITYSVIKKSDKLGFGIKLNIPVLENSKQERELTKKVNELNKYLT